MTTDISIMKIQSGDVISLHGPFRTVASITHGWRGNPRAARRAISIKYTDGTGSYFDSAAIIAKKKDD